MFALVLCRKPWKRRSTRVKNERHERMKKDTEPVQNSVICNFSNDLNEKFEQKRMDSDRETECDKV